MPRKSGWKNALDWGNAVAAMPSLHASFALIVPAFFLPWIKPIWLKAVVLRLPGDDADVAGVPGRALGDRRSRRLGDRRWFVLVLEPHRGSAATQASATRSARRWPLERMVMNPPSILLDHSFLIAVADTADTNHDEAVAIYRSLIDDFVAQRCLLVARADHLAASTNADLFAPIDKLHIARQHRNAADELIRGTPRSTSTSRSRWC